LAPMLTASSKGMPARATALQPDKDLDRGGLHVSSASTAAGRPAHSRHTVAKWFPGMSLSGRLSLFVALIVIGVVASVAYLEIRSFELDIERELMDAARLGAKSAADNIAAREGLLDPVDVRGMLHDLAEADPVLDAISVIDTDETGHSQVFASTSTEERAEAMEL